MEWVSFCYHAIWTEYFVSEKNEWPPTISMLGRTKVRRFGIALAVGKTQIFSSAVTPHNNKHRKLLWWNMGDCPHYKQAIDTAAHTSWVPSNSLLILSPGDNVRSHRPRAQCQKFTSHFRHQWQAQAFTTSDWPASSWGSNNPVFDCDLFARVAHRTRGNNYLHLLDYS